MDAPTRVIARSAHCYPSSADGPSSGDRPRTEFSAPTGAGQLGQPPLDAAVVQEVGELVLHRTLLRAASGEPSGFVFRFSGLQAC